MPVRAAHFGRAPLPDSAGLVFRGANGLFHWLESSGLGRSDWRKGNLSLPDLASRISLLLAWYLPQTVISIRHQTHPWENFGRNLTVFVTTLALLSYMKNDRLSLNTVLFNRWMKPDRLGGDYFDLLKTAGIDFHEQDRQRALWSKLDSNQIAKLEDFVGKLAPEAAHEGIPAWERRILEKLSNTDKQRLHALGTRFLSRVNRFRLLTTGLIIAAQVLLVGQLAMEFVFRTFARLDKDFDADEFKRRHLDLSRSVATASSTAPRAESTPSPAQPAWAPTPPTTLPPASVAVSPPPVWTPPSSPYAVVNALPFATPPAMGLSSGGLSAWGLPAWPSPAPASERRWP